MLILIHCIYLLAIVKRPIAWTYSSHLVIIGYCIKVSLSVLNMLCRGARVRNMKQTQHYTDISVTYIL